MNVKFLVAGVLVASVLTGCGGGEGEPEAEAGELLVFAAASLRDALEATRGAFEEAENAEITFSFAGSNVLAQQIEAAPRADVYFSASERWMDYVEERDLVDPGTRRTVLSNALVIVANARSPLTLDDPRALPELPFRFLSLGDPEAVPAGRYARQYLETLETAEGSVWSAVQDRVAPAPDVRAALGLVEAEPDVVGVVYRTDAAVSKQVRVLYEVPREEGPAISYSAAVLWGSGKKDLARRYLAHLQGPEASEELQRQGFIVPGTEAGGGG